MGEKDLTSNPNGLVRFLRKEPCGFTREDLITTIKEKKLKMLNFNHIGGDGRLKTLSISIRNEEQLRKLLDWGERVDGSSLFPYIDPKNSDLYIIPRFRTAFINPFSPIPTLNILCSYFDEKGNELEIAPEYIVKKAHQTLKNRTGISLQVLGELEYYVISRNQQKELFPTIPQRNYQESKPFVKYEDMNNEIMNTLTSMGIRVKYGHSEVGAILFENGTRCEQYEIEFDLEPLEDMADHIVIGRWIIRNIAAKHGVEITFAPKIALGHAGSGLHIHFAAMKDGKNILLDDDENLSEISRRIIGGLLRLAPSLTAFGNTNPVSYLRLVMGHEAPTKISWGDKNRSVLIRVPLGWRKITNFHSNTKRGGKDYSSCEGKQTIELRSPDGSANVHLLLAGVAVAAKYGLLNNESLELSEKCYVDMNEDENERHVETYDALPDSCFESAKKLKEHAHIYLEDGIFNERIIEGLEKQLESFNDENLNKELRKNKSKAEEYIEHFIHWG